MKIFERIKDEIEYKRNWARFNATFHQLMKYEIGSKERSMLDKAFFHCNSELQRYYKKYSPKKT